MEEWADLNIGTRALRERRVEKLEEGIDRRATNGGWIGAEQGRREGRFGDGELGGRHGGTAALGAVVDSVVLVVRGGGRCARWSS